MMENKHAVFNPDNKPESELPVIYGFNNGSCGIPQLYHAVAIAEDGTPLGGHGCSSEGFMPGDLGMIEGSRPDRHTNDFQPHYPNGYRCEFVPSESIEAHEGLQAAFAANKKLAPKEEDEG